MARITACFCLYLLACSSYADGAATTIKVQVVVQPSCEIATTETRELTVKCSHTKLLNGAVITESFSNFLVKDLEASENDKNTIYWSAFSNRALTVIHF